MTAQEKIAALEDMMELEAGTLTPETVLSDLDEWDSITLLSFIAMMEDEFHRIVSGSEVKQLKTVADAMSMMENNE